MRLFEEGGTIQCEEAQPREARAATTTHRERLGGRAWRSERGRRRTNWASLMSRQVYLVKHYLLLPRHGAGPRHDQETQTPAAKTQTQAGFAYVKRHEETLVTKVVLIRDPEQRADSLTKIFKSPGAHWRGVEWVQVRGDARGGRTLPDTGDVVSGRSEEARPARGAAAKK